MNTELEFKSLAAQRYNRIPLMLEAFADLETPLSLYLKLANARDGGTDSFLLESVVGGERFGRYRFIGLPARTLLRTSGFGAIHSTGPESGAGMSYLKWAETAANAQAAGCENP